MIDFKVGDKVKLLPTCYLVKEKIVNKDTIWVVTKVVFQDPGRIEITYGDICYSIHCTSIEHVGEAKKEDFKVDKLGWYKSRGGNFYKVIDFLEQYDMPVVVYNKNCKSLEYYLINGNRDPTGYSFSTEDLIEYIGPELPVKKEPRHFEFDGYMNEYDNMASKQYAIDKALGKNCSCLFSRKSTIKNEIQSKWRVTMTEILEDEIA